MEAANLEAWSPSARPSRASLLPLLLAVAAAVVVGGVAGAALAHPSQEALGEPLGALAVVLGAIFWLVRREVRRYEAAVAAQVRDRCESLERRVEERSARLVRAEKLAAVGALVHGVAHNVQSPLAAIVSYAAALERIMPGDEAPKEIARAAEEIRSMVRTLTQEGRRSSEEEVRPVDLNEVLRGAFARLEADLFFKHEVKRRLILDPALPPIEGVYGDFSQSVTNLVQNAIDALHGAPRREINAQTRLEDGAIVVEVDDTGPGVPEAVRAKLFDAFVTTKPLEATPGRPSGTGLGLWSARRLLAPYGATVGFESVPGHTTFRIRIPLDHTRGSAQAKKSMATAIASE